MRPVGRYRRSEAGDDTPLKPARGLPEPTTGSGIQKSTLSLGFRGELGIAGQEHNWLDLTKSFFRYLACGGYGFLRTEKVDFRFRSEQMSRVFGVYNRLRWADTRCPPKRGVSTMKVLRTPMRVPTMGCCRGKSAPSPLK